VLLLATAVFASVILLQVVLQRLCVFLDAGKFPHPGFLVNTSSGSVHVQQMGSGVPPVVLEAGIAASSLNWSVLQPQLGTHTSVYSYDRPGFGWSSPGSGACNLQRMAGNLHEVVAAARVPTPYILIGHSYAAYILGVYTQQFPDEIAGIILVDPLTPEEWVTPQGFQRWRLRRGVWFSRAGGVLGALGVIRFCLWLLQRGNNAAPRKVVSAFGGQARETVEHILTELAKLPPPTVRLIRERWSQGKFFWTMARYIKTLPLCAREASGHNIPAHIPLTVISGAHQPPVRVAEHQALAASSRQGRHLMAAKSAHWVHLDQPELIVEAFRTMVAELKLGVIGAPSSDVP
jgi:pimeloyl-ACP methyl ester carboxylesterase